MGFAAFGWLPPVAGALTQEVIDIAVILNALRALGPGLTRERRTLPEASANALRDSHAMLRGKLDRLREIADALDDAKPEAAVALIGEAEKMVAQDIVEHEKGDEKSVYPLLAKYLTDTHGLGALSRAHREITHLSRLLDRIADSLVPEEADRYLVRDAQRIIETIEALVRLHNAQEEDIYDYAMA